MSATILQIDDNEDNRYLVSFLLKARGHTVLEADSGRRGLELALERIPDLILLDIQLPEMDGLQVVGRIRGQPALAAVPIVVITSYAMVGDRERILGAGVQGYLEKPIDPDTFVEEVEGHLGKGGGG